MSHEDKKRTANSRLNRMLGEHGDKGAKTGKATNVDSSQNDGNDHGAEQDHEQHAGANHDAHNDHAHDAHANESTPAAAAPAENPAAVNARAENHQDVAPPNEAASNAETVETSSAAVGKGVKRESGDGTPAPAGAAPAGGAPAGGAPGAPGAAKKKGGTVTIKSEGTNSKNAGGPIAKLAVGEKATFSTSEEGDWTLDGASIGTGKEVSWTAPNKASLQNLSFQTTSGMTGSKPVMVLAPSKVAFTKLGDVPSAGPDMAGVGMQLQVTIQSEEVSFKGVKWLERPGGATGSGYFATYGLGKLFHNPEASWLDMGENNKGIIDNAWSRDKPKLMHPTEKKERWWAGSFSWTIPNAYQVNGTEQNFDSVVQTFTMADDGTMTVTKGGCSASAKPQSVTEGNDQRKFKTQDEAATYLRPHGAAGMLQAALNFKRDPKSDKDSIKFLGAALVAADLTFRADVTCNNTFSWTDPDNVTITANGQSAAVATKKINTGKNQTFDFKLNKCMDVASLTEAPIALGGVMADLTSKHAHNASIAYPYNGVEGTFNGSDRYTYKTFIAP